MERAEALATLVGRLLIAALFLGGAVQKAMDPTQVTEMLRGWGLPGGLVWVALVYNALAALALIAGVGARLAALSLAGYCGLTSFFHLIPDDPWQMTIFVKNWAIAGGCLILAVHGPGRWSLRNRATGLASERRRYGTDE